MTFTHPVEYTSRSPHDTESFAEALAENLSPGDTLLLKGGLGAGKTAFVRGLARGLGSRDHVSSPTFVFIHEYSSPFCPIIHVDLYRLGETGGVEGLGLEDYLDGRCLMVVEWPEYAPRFPWPGRVWHVNIEHLSEAGRLIRIFPPEDKTQL